MQTTDGKQFVFCVFGADGCECDSLEAVFFDDKAAIEYAENLLRNYNEDEYTFYGEPELLEVRQIEVGKKIDVLQPSAIWSAATRTGNAEDQVNEG